MKAFKAPTVTRPGASNSAGKPALAARDSNTGQGEPFKAVYYNIMFTKDPYTKKNRRYDDGVLELVSAEAARREAVALHLIDHCAQTGKAARVYDSTGMPSPL